VTDDEVIGTLQEAIEFDEMRDMFMKIREMTFESEPAVFVFYNSYARDNGFSIRKDIIKYSNGESKHLHLRRFVCSREGKCDSMLLTEDGRSCRLKPKSRCNCEAHLSVKFDKKCGVWWVSSFEDKHNHISAKPDEVPFLWSHRKIKEY
jgi:zinc finger SWIM domain-containing protein 3